MDRVVAGCQTALPHAAGSVDALEESFFKMGVLKKESQ